MERVREKQHMDVRREEERQNMSSENSVIEKIVEDFDHLLDVIQDLSIKAKPKLYAVNGNNHYSHCHQLDDLNVTQPPPPTQLPLPPPPPPPPPPPFFVSSFPVTSAGPPPTPPPRSHSKGVTSQLLKTSGRFTGEEAPCDRASSVPALCNEATDESAVHDEAKTGEKQERLALQKEPQEQKQLHVNHKQFISASGSVSSNVSSSSGSTCSGNSSSNGNTCLSQFVRKEEKVNCQKTASSDGLKKDSYTSGYFIDKLSTFNLTSECVSCEDTLENNNNQVLALPPCVCKLCTCKQSDDTCGVDILEAPMNNPKSIIIKSSYSSLPADVEEVRSTSSLPPPPLPSPPPPLIATVISPQIVVKVTCMVDYVPISKNNATDYFIGQIYLTWKEREGQNKQPPRRTDFSSHHKQQQPEQQQQQRKQYLMSLDGCNEVNSYSPESSCCCPDVKAALSSKSTPTLNERYTGSMNHRNSCKHTSNRLSVSSPSLTLKKPRITATTFKRQQFGQQVEALELSTLEKQLSHTLCEIENFLENTLQYKQFDCRSYNKTYDPCHIADTQTSDDLLTMPVYHKIQLYCKSYTTNHTLSVAHLVVTEMDALLTFSTRPTIDR